MHVLHAFGLLLCHVSVNTTGLEEPADLKKLLLLQKLSEWSSCSLTLTKQSGSHTTASWKIESLPERSNRGARGRERGGTSCSRRGSILAGFMLVKSFSEETVANKRNSHT